MQNTIEGETLVVTSLLADMQLVDNPTDTVVVALGVVCSRVTTFIVASLVVHMQLENEPSYQPSSRWDNAVEVELQPLQLHVYW